MRVTQLPPVTSFIIIISLCVCVCVLLCSQYGVVPEDTDGFRALLSGDQAELHGDGFVQRVLQQLVIVVHCDTHHWCVDDRTLGNTEANI